MTTIVPTGTTIDLHLFDALGYPDVWMRVVLAAPFNLDRGEFVYTTEHKPIPRTKILGVSFRD
jgi:hypothetical protein